MCLNYPDCIAGVNIYGAKSEQYRRLEVTVLGLAASTFPRIKGACSVIPFKGAGALKWGAPLYVGIEYNRITDNFES